MGTKSQGIMTKGQKNQIHREKIQERVNEIQKHGYKITSRRCGNGEDDVQLTKNGESVHPGSSFDYHSSALNLAESLINKEV